MSIKAILCLFVLTVVLTAVITLIVLYSQPVYLPPLDRLNDCSVEIVGNCSVK